MLSSSDCKIDNPRVAANSDIVMSFTYFQYEQRREANFKSLIIITKSIGPNLVPWGTPARTGSQLETVCPSLTHCHRSVTKEQYVTCYSKERFFFSCWYSFTTIWLRSFRGESQLMRLHFENNIFVVSRSSDRARLFAFNHPGLWFVSWLISRGGKKKEQFQYFHFIEQGDLSRLKSSIIIKTNPLQLQ